jgi:acyl dehydratase
MSQSEMLDVRNLINPRFFSAQVISNYTLFRKRVNAFIEASGDDQAIHTSSDAAKAAGLEGGPIVHGILLLGLLSEALAKRLLKRQFKNQYRVILGEIRQARWQNVCYIGDKVELTMALDREANIKGGWVPICFDIVETITGKRLVLVGGKATVLVTDQPLTDKR